MVMVVARKEYKQGVCWGVNGGGANRRSEGHRAAEGLGRSKCFEGGDTRGVGMWSR